MVCVQVLTEVNTILGLAAHTFNGENFETGYRRSGGISLIVAAKASCTTGSTGRWRVVVVGGWCSRLFSPRQFEMGRIGRFSKPPPQLGQTLCSTLSTQSAQNVHSNEQMRASAECGGKSLAQCSQMVRSSSIAAYHHNKRRTAIHKSARFIIQLWKRDSSRSAIHVCRAAARIFLRAFLQFRKFDIGCFLPGQLTNRRNKESKSI
jgi:hypothetical protein